MVEGLSTQTQYYRVNKKDIGFLKFIIEGYDGIAVLTTVNAAQNLVKLVIPPGCEKEADLLMDALKDDIFLEALDRPSLD